jgi:hypothetical protein
MVEVGNASGVNDLPGEDKTVVEREEWIRARHQIALIVRSTVAEAILPLQESLASIVQRLDDLGRAERHDAPASAEQCDVPAKAEHHDVPPSAEHHDVPPGAEHDDAPANEEHSEVPASAEHCGVLASEPTPTPAPAEDTPAPPAARAATMLPPPLPQRASIPYLPPPMAPSALKRLGDLAGRLRRERGIDVSPMELAALLLERVAAVLDERVAAELAKNSSLTKAATSPDDDRWS